MTNVKLMSMTPTLLAAGFVVLIGACLQNHQNGAVEIRGGDCASCHIDEYNNATNPPHVGVNPITCGDCHSEVTWRPASGGTHPESRFAITAGAHIGIACGDCHTSGLGSAQNGGNTDCIACHPKGDITPSHNGRTGFVWMDMKKNFCLQCHPNGRVKGGQHPEAKFSIASGAHSGITCQECHVAADGANAAGMNTNCQTCHPRSWADPKHAAVSGYPATSTNKHYCLLCHPNGRNN
jgi:hypothetical protein